MALSANLYLRQSQSLVMTPQLMQSIQLLQMTHFELNQFIAQEVEKNPLLEFPSNDAETGSDRAGDDDDGHSRQAEEQSFDEDYDSRSEVMSGDWSDRADGAGAGRMSDELDANYANVFPDDGVPQRADAPELISQWKSMPGGGEGGADGYDLDDFVAGQVSLRDHLAQQMHFVLPDMADQLIGQYLADQLDEAGYLHADLAEAAERLGAGAADVERVLAALQTLDPPGVFARNLSECLAIQLRQKDRLDPAMQAFVGNLELLARRDFATLKRLCGVDEEDLLDMLSEIRQLNPKPGSGFETAVSEAIMPDVVVRPSADGSWLVELNPDTLPRVLVNQAYFAKVTKNGDDHAFLSECLQTANWLTRSLDQRAKTIMKVATEIVRQQDAFLLHGVDHLRPLNLKTVADAIKMHESTVSRVTSNKYMLTPRGLFELKYFFTVSISAVEGGDSHSAEAVRHKIRALIAQESPDAVLSDDDIVDILKGSGVELARRTVAKYREAMNIASSVQRRREKRALAKVAGF
ncbi:MULTISPECIES: RNA polymerase factor sigma-54 [unclassified Rhizobium]|uniref:RNA polymerase factor sigma-54 n=1 Tax=unclassified Rhizobium TaxID=2613769 RepID=UPI001AD967C7|nr:MULTISPECIES: RNA polymerase factor sigma-54 [unclassified Rhizobium]MBO9122471.1 RNA polymerase factor sigma-54 [Rhizobium sp. 16-488-2b]MBO9173002.1 RNA polymerase factor sigma-54 [Rhizobium sp. 16-488-2a]